MIYELCEPVA